MKPAGSNNTTQIMEPLVRFIHVVVAKRDKIRVTLFMKVLFVNLVLISAVLSIECVAGSPGSNELSISVGSPSHVADGGNVGDSLIPPATSQYKNFMIDQGLYISSGDSFEPEPVGQYPGEKTHGKPDNSGTGNNGSDLKKGFELKIEHIFNLIVWPFIVFYIAGYELATFRHLISKKRQVMEGLDI